MPRISHLQAAPARVRFLSVEPLLEDLGTLPLEGIHWVIVGGESGHGARKMEEAWVTSIRDQCRTANVLFFFKQWGGVQKKRNGRMLGSRTYDDMPARSTILVPHADERRVLQAQFDLLAQAFAPGPIPLRPTRKVIAAEQVAGVS